MRIIRSFLQPSLVQPGQHFLKSSTLHRFDWCWDRDFDLSCFSLTSSDAKKRLPGLAVGMVDAGRVYTSMKGRLHRNLETGKLCSRTVPYQALAPSAETSASVSTLQLEARGQEFGTAHIQIRLCLEPGGLRHSSMLGDKQVFIAWKCAGLKLLRSLPAFSSKFNERMQCSHERPAIHGLQVFMYLINVLVTALCCDDRRPDAARRGVQDRTSCTAPDCV